MWITAVLCLCAAVVIGIVGVWLLVRPRPADPVQQVLRAVAPVQLAAAVMLAAGGVVALSAGPETAIVVVSVCVIGAVGTIAAGCWHSAKMVARSQVASSAAGAGCGSGGNSACASCTLSCR